jgi:hypothetical protein
MKRRQLRNNAVSDREATTVVAALYGEDCPPTGNPFLHLDALDSSRSSRSWPRVRRVFASLPRADRVAIVQHRRQQRLHATVHA